MKTVSQGLCMLKVPKKMQKTKPKLYKVMGMEAYYKKYKHFYGKIIVNRKFEIIDGYVIYYTAKKLKVSSVPIVMVSPLDRIKHFFRHIF